MTLRIFHIVLFSWFAVNTFGQSQQQKTYAVVVKFVSIGAGVPDNKPIMDFIAGFKKKYKIREIKVDRIGPLGREGEYDLALPLSELSKKQKKLFIQQIKKVKNTSDRGLMQFEENVTYDKSKQPVRGKAQTIKID